MAAIRIATALGQEGNIFETLVEPITCAKQAQLSHSRGVNQHGALTQDVELPACRRMGALSRCTDRLRVKGVLTDQAVEKRRLPDTL